MAKPVFQNIPIKVPKKNSAGDLVKSDRTVVKTTDTARSGQRISRDEQSIPCSKVKASGKYESKAMLCSPFLNELVKLLCVPMTPTTPQPPFAFEITPAWIAAPQT